MSVMSLTSQCYIPSIQSSITCCRVAAYCHRSMDSFSAWTADSRSLRTGKPRHCGRPQTAVRRARSHRINGGPSLLMGASRTSGCRCTVASITVMLSVACGIRMSHCGNGSSLVSTSRPASATTLMSLTLICTSVSGMAAEFVSISCNS